jgi:SAM-dependent methyltransferase
MSARWPYSASGRWPHRVKPLIRTLEIRERRCSIPIQYEVGAADQYIFTADFYAYRQPIHPERHLGWWRFVLPQGRGTAMLHCQFGTIGRESVWLEIGGTRIEPLDSWSHPGFEFDPLGDLVLAMRDAAGTTKRTEPVLVKFFDRDILLAFYARQYSTSGYAVPEDAPFLLELHYYKLRQLRRLFERYIPAGGRVVDVGCGRSLFSELETRFPFSIVSGDLDFKSVSERAKDVPHQSWGVFDAAAIPFRDQQFDALFAGEVIEHVADVHATLEEWARVLKPGGVAIITTPNRERLVALADGIERPYSIDHLSELSYRQLTRDLLPKAGFESIDQSCLHLELLLENLFNDRRVDDRLQTRYNRRKYIGLIRRCMPLGRWFPWYSMDLVVVARKK